jgi:hypothetical protein
MLPVDLVIDLFDKTVLPILTYGCELWGFEMNDIITRLQLKFYKFVLKLRLSTPTLMVFGETGKYPVSVSVKCRMLCFWFKLCNRSFCNGKLSRLVYNCLLHMYQYDIYKNKYLQYIETMLNEIGLSYVWQNQTNLNVSISLFKSSTKRSLMDQYIQYWYTHVDNDAVYTNYRMYKTVFGADSYFYNLPANNVLTILKFCTTNNQLPVNKLRFQTIPRCDRLCVLCDLNDIGDEYHYLFVCPHFAHARQKFIKRYYSVHPSAFKFQQLFTSRNKVILKNFARFITCINAEIR